MCPIAMHSSSTDTSCLASAVWAGTSAWSCTERLRCSSFLLRSLMLNQPIIVGSTIQRRHKAIIFIMEPVQTAQAWSKTPKLNNFVVHNRRNSLTSRNLEMFRIPSQVTLDPPIGIADQQMEPCQRTLTPLEKFHKVRDRMFSQCTTRRKSAETAPGNTCVFELRGSNYENNLFARQILNQKQPAGPDPDLTREGKLIAKYLKFISSKASKSLENQGDNNSRPVSSLRWLKDSQKKHSFVEQLEKYQLERSKKASAAKELWLECLPHKYPSAETPTYASARKTPVKGIVHKFKERKSENRLSIFKMQKQKRKPRILEEQIQLKPWEATKEDFYSFL